MDIVTERLVIREFEPDDWQDVLQYTSDPVVMHYMPEPVHTEETVKQFLEQNKGEKAHHYAVMLQEDQHVIGHMVFHPWFGEHTYEIGWVFNSTYHRRGLPRKPPELCFSTASRYWGCIESLRHASPRIHLRTG